MAVEDPLFCYEARLESFQATHSFPKRRASNASSKASKSISWPHAKYLSPLDLAKAGFSWQPIPDSLDNVECFLCHKSLDGWEQGDNALDEHVKHSSHCGWAIVAAIEADLGEYGKEDPNLPHMIEARKATFADRWPHEGKRGWKCKTKQLAEAGWKYTPTPDYDDMATCTYCELALDGWEPGDKPMDEHYSRSPECPFFALIAKNPGAKKAVRGKGVRSSKASRISIQSVATTFSDTASVNDLAADVDDSILTTTSAMGGKRGGRAKKATAAKGKKTRTKKDEVVEVPEADLQDVEMPPPPPPKPTRARKRGSDAMDDSVLTVSEAPAAKKRATKNRGSIAADSSILGPAPEPDVEMTEALPAAQPAGRKKGRGSNSRSTRKASGSSLRSMASTASLRAAPDVPDDDELDRQLEADLDRPLTDDENVMGDSDSERKKRQAPKAKAKKGRARKGTTASQESNNDYAMFDPAPVVPDEAVVDAELKQLEAEMAIDDQETLQVPKKGRKAGVRKASKQTKAQKAKEDKEAAEAALLEEPHPVEDHNPIAATVVTSGDSARTSTGKGRGRPNKSSNAARGSIDQVNEAQAADPGNKAEAETATVSETFASAQQTPEPAAQTPRSAVVPSANRDKALPQPPSSAQRHLAQPPATPRSRISPAQSARQPVISPSPSPQSSDAENQPPSSKPATATQKRVILAPITATPARAASPSKRNVLEGLRSTTPWNPIDLNMVLGSPHSGGPNKENGVERFLKKGSDLTSPEKRMTVEDWIYHNASQAEQKLKLECETMVSKFEHEGTKAMNVLEGLIVE